MGRWWAARTSLPVGKNARPGLLAVSRSVQKNGLNLPLPQSSLKMKVARHHGIALHLFSDQNHICPGTVPGDLSKKKLQISVISVAAPTELDSPLS